MRIKRKSCITRCVRKVPGLVSQMIYFKSNYKLQVVPFKVIPLESNALSHPSLPCLHALLEGFFRDPPQLRRHGLFNVVHIFKTSPLDNPLELGEEEKVTWSQVGQVERLLQHGDVLLGQELPDAQPLRAL